MVVDGGEGRGGAGAPGAEGQCGGVFLRPVAGGVHRRPVAACGAFSLLGFACLCGLISPGMVTDEDKADPSKLYLPKDDIWRISSDYHDKHFEKQRLAQYIITAEDGGPILTRQAVMSYFAFRDDIYALEVKDHRGQTHTLGDPVDKPVEGRDLCYDSYMNMGLPPFPGVPPNMGCMHFSSIWMWKNDRANVPSYDEGVAAAAARGGVEECRSNDTGAVCTQPPYNLPVGMLVGGPCGGQPCEDGRVPTALQGWIFLDDRQTDKMPNFTASQWKDLVLKWEHKFIDLGEGKIPGKGRYPGVKVQVTTQSAITDQVTDDVKKAMPAIIACACIMLGAPLALLSPRAGWSVAAHANAMGATAGAVMLGDVGVPIGFACLTGAHFAQSAAFIIYPLIFLSVVHVLHFVRRLGSQLAALPADPDAAFAAAFADAVGAAVRCGAATFIGVGAVAWHPGAAHGFSGVLAVVMVSSVTRALTVAFGVAPIWALTMKRSTTVSGDPSCDTPTASSVPSSVWTGGTLPRPPAAVGAVASFAAVAALVLSGIASAHCALRVEDKFGRQDLVDPHTKQGEFFKASNTLFEPFSPFRAELMFPYRDWSDPHNGRKFYELTERVTYDPHFIKDATVPMVFGYGERKWSASTSWYSNLIDWIVTTQDHPLTLIDDKFPPNNGTGPGTFHQYFTAWMGLMNIARSTRFTGITPFTDPLPTPEVPTRQNGVDPTLHPIYELDPTRPSRLTAYAMPMPTLAVYKEMFDVCERMARDYKELGVMWFIPSFVNIKPFAHVHERTMLLLWAAPAAALPLYALLRPGADSGFVCALAAAAFIALCVAEQQQMGVNFDPLTLPWTACVPSLALSLFAVVCDGAGAAAAVDGGAAAAAAGLAAGAAGGLANWWIHTPVMTKPALALGVAGVTAAAIAALWVLPLRLFWVPLPPRPAPSPSHVAERAKKLRRAMAARFAAATAKRVFTRADLHEVEKLVPKLGGRGDASPAAAAQAGPAGNEGDKRALPSPVSTMPHIVQSP